MSSADKQEEKTRARELFDRVTKALGAVGDPLAQTNGHTQGLSSSARKLGEDIEMYIEIAKLYQDDNHERMERAYKQALKNSEASGSPDPRLVNNLAALEHLHEHLDEARSLYEQALTHAAGLDQSMAEAMSTSILYNLARVYEDQGETAKAREAYDKLLARHPEYIDGEYPERTFVSDRNLIALQPSSDKPRCWLTLTSITKLTTC